MNAISPFHGLSALIASGEIQDVINSIAPNLSITFSKHAQRYEYCSGRESTFSAETTVEIGCVIKVLTVILYSIAVADGRVRFEDKVTKFFPNHGNVHASLKIFHLLNYSHGLDGSSLAHLPRTADGYIDGDSIWRVVTDNPPVSSPGALFYYHGHAGMWLAGSILEQIHQSIFANLLKALLDRIGIASRISDAHRVCPAMGGLALSARDLQSVCAFHLQTDCHSALTDALWQCQSRFFVPLPVWPISGDSAGMGWFRFPGATFGALGHRGDNSALILVSREESSSVTVTGLGNSALRARRRLFEPFMRSKDYSPLRLLTKPERKSFKVEQIVGRYRNASLLLEIVHGKRGKMSAAIYACRSKENIDSLPLLSRTLFLSTGNFLFPKRIEGDLMPYIRLEKKGANGLFSYACTGRHVFRRVV